jgi:glucose-1-phosphate adenylyltransferase
VPTRLASMGIYIFNLDVLVRRLVEETQSSETMSFTYGVLPNMVGRDRVFVYPFKGYWRDVGSIDSYFDANMELIHILPELNLYDMKNPIRSRIRFEPPAKVCDNGFVKNSVVTQGCLIDGHVERSVIFPHVRIEKGAEIYDSLIMPNNHVGEGAVIRRSIIDTSSRARHVEGQPNIGSGSRIGDFGESAPNREHPGQLNSGITLVGMESEVPNGTVVGRNCIIYPDTRTEDFGDRRVIEDGDSIHPRPQRM